MSVVYTYAKAKLISGDIDLNTDSIRAILVMTNTTCGTEEDVQFLSGVNGFTTLDECDGAGYARQTLTTLVVDADTVNNRGEFHSDAAVFANVGVGTRQIAGILLYKHVGADGANIPICYITSGGFPFWTNGANVTVTPNAEGWLQAT